MSDRSALVTGSSGFIGTYLVQKLCSEGLNVIGTDLRPPLTLGPVTPTAFTFKSCDITDPESVTKIVRESQPDYIFHLAARHLPGKWWDEPLQTFNVNVGGTINLLEALRECPTHPRVFVACSSAEYGGTSEPFAKIKENAELNPLHQYGVSKAAQDLLARQYFQTYGLATVRGRMFNTIGPLSGRNAPDDFARGIVRIELGLQDKLTPGTVNTIRDFTDVRDMVNAMFSITELGELGEAYNLCTGEGTSVRQILEILARNSRRRIQWTPTSALLRPIDEDRIVGDNSKLLARIDWKRTVALEKTLVDILEFYRLHPPTDAP